MRTLRRLLRRGGMSSGGFRRYMAAAPFPFLLEPPPGPRVLQRSLDRLELLEGLTGSDGHAGKWGLGEHGRHLALLAHPLGHALEERATARQDHPPLHEIARQFGRRSVERVAH